MTMEPSPTHTAASQPSPPVEVSEAERCHEDHLWTFPNTRPRHPDVFRVALDKWRVSSARPGTLMHLIATRSARGDDVFARDDALKGCVDRLGARFTRNMLVTDTQSVGAPHGIVTRMQVAYASSSSSTTHEGSSSCGVARLLLFAEALVTISSRARLYALMIG